MHPLVAAVLLRLARIDPLQLDPGLGPARRQARQAARTRARKRRAVVRAQRQRHAVAPERRLDRRHDRRRARRHDHDRKKIPAPRIADRQRIAARAVPGPEPALEVDAPDIVRTRRPERTLRRRQTAPQTAARHKTLRAQKIAHRARRRPHRPGVLAHQHRPKLPWTPERMRQAQRHDRIRNLRRHRTAVAQRRARTLLQTGHAAVPVPAEPLIARLAADPVRRAQRRHRRLAAMPRQHKIQLLVHPTGLSPGHIRSSRNSLNLSPIYPV